MGVSVNVSSKHRELLLLFWCFRIPIAQRESPPPSVSPPLLHSRLRGSGPRPPATAADRWPIERLAQDGEEKTPPPPRPPPDFIRFPSQEFEPIDSRIYIELCAGSINIDPPFPVRGVNEAFSKPTALWRTYVKPPLPLSMQSSPTHNTHTHTVKWSEVSAKIEAGIVTF